MELDGFIKLIGATQTFGQNGFQKREIVITTEEQYPQSVVFEFTQDKVSLLDAFQPGQKVRISFNIRGREWQNPQGEIKYFNSLQGWRIQDLSSAMPSPAQPTASVQNTPSQAQPFATVQQPDFIDDEDDDLPF